MRIALDAMGGDFGVTPNLEGAIAALKDNPDLQVTLVGDVGTLESAIAKSGYRGDRLRVHPADGWIEMSEKPIDGLRKKPTARSSSAGSRWQLNRWMPWSAPDTPAPSLRQGYALDSSSRESSDRALPSRFPPPRGRPF